MTTSTPAPPPTSAPAPAAPWHALYPAPRSTPSPISRDQVLALLKAAKSTTAADTTHTNNNPKQHFILIDLRRNDHEGGTICSSLNLPAQSLYPSIPTLYAVFLAAGVGRVIWYCSSSKGRGTRAAGWFQDYIESQGGNGGMESLVLVGGLKGWVEGGGEFVDWVEGLDAGYWSKE